MSERVTMYDLKNDVRSEVVNSFEEIFNSSSPERRLDELVDSYCPIYYADILECAISDFQLAVSVPEAYAFNGEHTAINAISGNIYEALYQEVYDQYEQLKEAREEGEE